jgi:hypothetical protein
MPRTSSNFWETSKNMNTFKELKKLIKGIIKENPLNSKSSLRGLFMDINDMVKEGKLTVEERDLLIKELKK